MTLAASTEKVDAQIYMLKTLLTEVPIDQAQQLSVLVLAKIAVELEEVNENLGDIKKRLRDLEYKS